MQKNSAIEPFLRSLPLLKGLPEEAVAALAAHARLTEYLAGEVILAEREKGQGLYLLVEGRAKVFRATADGREQTIYLFGPGEPFCLCAQFAQAEAAAARAAGEPEPMPATATALTDCRVLVVEREPFLALAHEHPSVLFAMVLILSRRLKEAMDRIESLSMREIPVRLAAFLVHQTAGGAGTGGIEADRPAVYNLETTHRELAKIIGATPEALSRAFRKLGEEGYLEVTGREVVLLDLPGLAALAGVSPASGI